MLFLRMNKIRKLHRIVQKEYRRVVSDQIVTSSRVPLSGPFRVGIIATLGPYLMPLLLPTLRKKHPDLELILHEGLTTPLLAALQAGSLDVVIAAAPLDMPNINQIDLFDEPFYLAIPVEHPLAKREVVNTTDLHGDKMVLLEDGRKIVLAWRKSFARDPDVRLLAELICSCLPENL